MLGRRSFLQVGAFVGSGIALSRRAGATVGGGCASTTDLTPFLDELPIPSVLDPTERLDGSDLFRVRLREVQQQLHAQLCETPVWGYEGLYPGPTIEAVVGERIFVRYEDELPDRHLLPVDTTIHGAEEDEPGKPVRVVTHLHEGRVPAFSDGYPEATFEQAGSALYQYPNDQRAATMWYHDHALGITRLNVYAGLAGFYLLRDRNERRLGLPRGRFEIPLVIQDRTFNPDGTLFYPASLRDNPEFFGDKVLVNGKVWPFLEVEPRKYRFRILNGSNARFYNLRLLESTLEGDILTPPVRGPKFVQIGNDGGLLPAPDKRRTLLLAPAERADVIIDFSGHLGEHFVLFNDAPAPFPGGDRPVVPTALVMQFRVTRPLRSPDESVVPPILSDIRPISEASAVRTRDITLDEVPDTTDTQAPPRTVLLLNKKRWNDPAQEKPKLDTVEIWRFINSTVDTHPMHIHLVTFQILDRQPFDVEEYLATGNVTLLGAPEPPEANERGFKDTVRVPPGVVTRVIMRFSGFAGRYVYHCHILDHEDNEMMRPYEVIP